MRACIYTCSHACDCLNAWDLLIARVSDLFPFCIFSLFKVLDLTHLSAQVWQQIEAFGNVLLQLTAKDAFVGLFIGVQTEWCMH